MLWQYITTLSHRATASPEPKNSQQQIKTYHLFHCPNSRLKENQNYCQKSIYQCSHNDTIPWAANNFKEFLEERGQRMSPGFLYSWKPTLSTTWGTIPVLPAGGQARRGQQHPCLVCRRTAQHRPLTCQLGLYVSSKMSEEYIHISIQKT